MSSPFRCQMVRVVVAMLLVASHLSVQAAWVWRVTETRWVGTMQYNGSTIDYRYKSGDSLDTFRPLVSARDRLYASLRASLNESVRAELVKVPEYRGHGTSLTGPLTLSLSGIPGSVESNITLTGPTARVSAHFERYVLAIVKVSCDLNISTGTITLNQGRFNPLAGTITGLRFAEGFAPSYSQDCSSSIGWIPVIGDLVDGFINRKVGGLVDGLFASGLAKVQQMMVSQNFAGLDLSLPPGKFMLGTVDVGSYLRNNLANFFQQNTIRIRFDEPVLAAGRFSQLAEFFSISFSLPNLSFSAALQDARELVWYCPPGGPRCLEP